MDGDLELDSDLDSYFESDLESDLDSDVDSGIGLESDVDSDFDPDLYSDEDLNEDLNENLNEDLITACKEGDREKARELIDRGADVNAIDKGGQTTVMCAIHAVDIDIGLIDDLIDRGADVNAKDSKGMSALRYAILKKRRYAAKKLIDRGADVHERDENGDTLLKEVCATVFEEKNMGKGYIWGDPGGLVEKLVTNGVNINERVVKSNGKTLLIATCEEGNIELAKILIDRGADINARDADGGTALIEACKKGNIELAKILIDNGANVNARDMYGNTALIYTCKGEDEIELAKILIEAGATVNAVNRSMDTALKEACEKENKELAKILIKEGADVNLKNKVGRIAFDFIDSISVKRELGLYSKQYMDEEVQKEVDKENSMNVAKGKAKDESKDIEVLDFFGDTALKKACKAGDMIQVKKLIEAGADINVVCGDGKTVFMWACEQKNEELIKALLDGSRVDAYAVDRDGKRTLEYFVDGISANKINIGDKDKIKKLKECIEMLIERGVNKEDMSQEMNRRGIDVELRKQLLEREASNSIRVKIVKSYDIPREENNRAKIFEKK